MISFDSQNKIFKIDTKSSSYVLGIYDGGYLLNLYFGEYIPDTNLWSNANRIKSASFSSAVPECEKEIFSTDVAPMEYSVSGRGDYRISALEIKNKDGNTVTDIRYKSHKIYCGKPDISPLPQIYLNSDDEADSLEILMEDSYTGALVTLYYTAFKNLDVIVRSVNVTNTSKDKFSLERIFSMCLDLPSMDYDFITLYGCWSKERVKEQRALSHGIQGVQSKRGSSSHNQNPFAAFLKHGGTEDTGEAIGINLIYSGNFEISAECDYSCTTRIIMGINPEAFSWVLEPGCSFQAPEAVIVRSSDGLGGMSRTFHDLYNNNLVRGRYKTEKRPLLINSWEAAFFDFDTDKLVSFASEAKELGIEMLVMDDGWFGKRNDDTNSLGDWFVNEEKLPGGLGVLIDKVNALGMKFGIWYEPEMISPDSDLFRAHPDWHVHVNGRAPSRGRQQYVLDVSREDVRDNIFNQIASIFDKYKIDYIKWDFNRNISEAGSALLSAENSGEFFHRFIMGTYELMDRFTKAYPDVLFENCSGGGGRFDPGMLYYSPQIWTSDNTDPIERIDIQFGTSLCYPASVMGAHVSASRRTGYETKGNVAQWGTFGYELDPTKLTEQEKEIVKGQVADYHKYYDLIRNGDLYRLLDPHYNKNRVAWSFVAKDKSGVLVTVVTIKRLCRELFFLKLKGLNKNAFYKNEEDGQVYSGAMLMNAGLNLSGKSDGDGESFVLHFVQVD